MEPFEIRTVPARLSLVTIVITLVVLGVAVYAFWTVAETTVLAARTVPGDPSRFVVCTLLLVVCYAMTWVYLRMFAPLVQVVGMYLLRDRGKQVVAYRLDESGWRHVVAGTDVVIPWIGMTVAVTERTDEHFHIRVTSDGPFAAGRDPFSRQVRRTFRKERGFTIPMTRSNPTEEELASAIAHQSAGRVALAR